MAKSIQALREERTDLAKTLRNHYDKFDGDDAPNWDKQAQETYDNLKSQIESVDEKIKRHEELLNIEASQVAAVKREAEDQNISEDEAEHNRSERNTAIKLFLMGGMSALNDDQRQSAHQQAARFNGGFRNAMSTGTGSEGGYTTQNEFGRTLMEALKAFGGIRQVATVVPSETGQPLDWPTTDATAETGEIVGENASVSLGETTFGTKQHTVFKWSSKSIAIPFELLQDSLIDIEGYITGLLQTRLGRITNNKYTVGAGTTEPWGIVTDAAAGKVGATGQTTTVKFSDLNALIHSVDPAYRQTGKCGFMFNDDTLRALKDEVDGQNRPLWLPGVTAGDPDMIYRYGYTVNQDVAVMAANAKSVLFGDFSKFIIRDMMAVQLFRMTDSKYTEKGQVGFLAFMRSGGRLIDVGGAVKYYQNSAT